MKKHRQILRWPMLIVGILMSVSISPVYASPELSITKNTPPDQLPFWKKKPELIRKIREDRAVLVSVRREDVGHDDLIRFTMAAGGEVARPKDFCFRVSQDYPKLKEISDHFKTVTFNPITNELYLVTEALSYEARMMLKITPVSEEWRSELQWQVISGHFKGMTGLIGFERVDDKHTEMSMSGKYEAKEFPLPKILMGFALEVIMQKVAEKMRTFIEAQPAMEPASSPSPSPTPPKR